MNCLRSVRDAAGQGIVVPRGSWGRGMDQDGSVSPFFVPGRGVQVQFVLVWATFHVLTSWKNYYYIIILSTSNSAQGDCVCVCAGACGLQ